jgi:hypothetical protein
MQYPTSQREVEATDQLVPSAGCFADLLGNGSIAESLGRRGQVGWAQQGQHQGAKAASCQGLTR